MQVQCRCAASFSFYHSFYSSDAYHDLPLCILQGLTYKCITQEVYTIKAADTIHHTELLTHYTRMLKWTQPWNNWWIHPCRVTWDPTVSCTMCEILLLMGVSIRDTTVQTHNIRIISINPVLLKSDENVKNYWYTHQDSFAKLRPAP